MIKRYCLIIISALFLSALFAAAQEVENSSDTNGKNETIQQQVQPEIIDEQQNTNLGHSPENNENPNPTTTHIPFLLIVLLFTSLISTAVALFIAYKFYFWRTRLQDTGALYPEEWSEFLADVANRTNENSDALQKLEIAINTKLKFSEKSYQLLIEEFQVNRKHTEALKEMLLVFQQTLKQKEDEIDRLKQGYDFTILKKSLIQLANLHAECVALLNKDIENKNLKNFEMLLLDLIEKAGVIVDSPDIGEDFSALADYVEVVGHTSINGQNLDKGQISEVLSKIYLYKQGESNTVLRKSKVKYHLPEE